MWLVFAKNQFKKAIRFPREHTRLFDYLQEPDVDYYAYALPNYFEDRDIPVPIDFDPEEPWQWLQEAPDELLKDFQQWVYSGIHVRLDDTGPPHSAMNVEQHITKPIWMIHFTDSASRIEDKGFQFGHPNFNGLAMTTWKRDRQKEPGYNFAFRLNSRDAGNAMQTFSYGRQAVIFKGTGVQVYHSGDQQEQVIFWGPSVDPASIYKLVITGEPYEHLRDANIDPHKMKSDFSNYGFVIYDATNRLQFIGESSDEVVAWIEKDGERILTDVRNKIEHHRKR